MSTPFLPHIRYLVAVASGKGGVGKTTVTVRLALALRRAGRRVGIFDADVYGPNVPMMLGVHRRQRSEGFVPVVRRAGAPPYIPPLHRHGLAIMSVGLLLAEDQLINPPAATAGQLVIQTMRDVNWGALDVLLIDLPPSAGQPQEDLLRVARLDGVLLVTTPQDMSLLDAGRSLEMFRESGTPVLGLVENMSGFVCPGCGEEHAVFARSAQWSSPLLADVPLAGRIPLTPQLSTPIKSKVNDISHVEDGVFDDLASTVWQALAGRRVEAEGSAEGQ